MSALHRLIHGGCRQLGLDDDARRGLYLRLVKKDSLNDMSAPEMQLVADELRRLGYKPGAPKASGREGKPALDGKYLPKMRALWNMGEVKDRRDSALEAFALGRILGLRRLQIEDDTGDWEKAMNIIGDSVRVMASKEYARFYMVDKETGVDTPIRLDLANA